LQWRSKSKPRVQSLN